MLKAKQKTRTFYRYAAAYFVVLFILSGLLVYSVLSFSAKRIVSLEKNNARNVLQRAADILEKQYQNLEGIAAQITASADYRPSTVNSGPVYDIELLKAFKQFANYSPLARQYFLVYNSINKIYTSSGNTSYFDYYAPVNLNIPYDMTAEALLRITEAKIVYFERSGSSILMVFPLRIYGSNDTRTASLCFIMTEEQVKSFLNQMTVGLPDVYSVYMGGKTLLSASDGAEIPVHGKDTIFAVSERGRFSISAIQKLTGWQELISNSFMLILVTLTCLALALGLALLLAKFSLRPLDQLIQKYMPQETKIENEFRQLDAVLESFNRQHSDIRRQLKDHLLMLVLRGEYSEDLFERWALLDISFDLPDCCVFLIQCEENKEEKEHLRKQAEALSTDNCHLYTAEAADENQIILVANYGLEIAVDDIFQKIRVLSDSYGFQTFAGTPVDSPKRLPISYMTVLTAKQYQKPSDLPLFPDQADNLSEKLFSALEAEDEKAEERACTAIEAYLSDEPLNGAMTKHHIYELISCIMRIAEERDMMIDRMDINALVLLPDTPTVIHDLKEILKKSIVTRRQTRPASDDTARLIVEYVIANAFDPDLSLQEMSEAFGLSADYISTMIKRETGSAFKEYVTMLRIGEARRLLNEDKSLSVSDVALKVGYRKTSNFSKKFKDLTGSLPSQF